MLLLDFQKKLGPLRGKKLKLTINDNRSTMLSVKWERDCTRVSLHRMFLQAPQNVVDDLAGYIRGEDRSMTPTVKSFIEQGIQRLDYSGLISSAKLHTSGRVYDLQEVYDSLNWEYFNNSLALLITWFGRAQQKSRRQISFGLYHAPLKLIKIHRKLDSTFVPRYVVAFIIYHEMLHHLYPPFIDAGGRCRIHHAAFKIKESQFKDYDRAQQWLKEHRHQFFLES